jgi:hypothetical protein
MGGLCSGPPPAQDVELNSPDEDLIQARKHRTESGRLRAERRKVASSKSYVVVPIGADAEKRISDLEVEKIQLSADKLVLTEQLRLVNEQLEKQKPVLREMNFALSYIEEYKKITDSLTGRGEEIEGLTKSGMQGTQAALLAQ